MSLSPYMYIAVNPFFVKINTQLVLWKKYYKKIAH
jgi:hypothetical protein